MKKIILALLLCSNLLYADAKQSTNRLYKLLDKVLDRIELLVDEDLTNDKNEKKERKEDAGYRNNKETDRSGNEEQNRKED
jgi:hypothetical protein